jgi:hypothetical protein
VVGAAIALTLAIATASNGTVGPDTLNAAEVASIFAQYSAKNNVANATLSLTLQAHDEGGTSLNVDDSGFIFDARAGYTNADGTGRYYSFSDVPDQAAVSTSTTYPQTFISLLSVKQAKDTPAILLGAPDLREWMVVSRASASSPWRNVLFITTSTHAPALAETNDVAVAPSESGLEYPLTQMESDLATNLGHFAATGKFGHGLSITDFTWTKSHPWDIPNLAAIAKSFKSEGFDITITVTPLRQTDVHVYALTGGNDLVTASVHIEYRENYPKGWVEEKSIRGDPYTWEIAAGKYKWVEFPQVCTIGTVDNTGTSPGAVGTSPTVVGATCTDVTGARGVRY